MSQGFRQSQAGLHTWSGLLVGWVLYLIFLNGAVSYWREEITRWAQPEIAATRDLDVVTRGAIAHLATVAPDARSWQIALPNERASGAITSYRPKGGGERARRRGPDRTQALIGPEGEVTTVRDTEGGDLFYRLHFDLRYVPPLWGRWVAGFCAMFMLVAIISGVITHKKIFTDFFTFRPGKGQRSWLDGHNALAVLALPFHAMITYTGLVTLMVIYVPWGVEANYPSRAAYYADITPRTKPLEPTGQAAPMADIGQVLRTADTVWGGGHAALIRIENPGDAASRIVVNRRAGDKLVDGRWEIVFDGATGQVRSSATPDSSGLIARGGMIGIHASRFAPITLRWLFFLSGLAGAAMIASGLVLWTVKRRQRLPDPARPYFGFWLVERLNIGAVAGLPLAMTGFLWANRLLPVGMVGRADWEGHAMFLIWGAALIHAFVRPPRPAWIEQLSATALLLIALPVFNLIATDRGLVASLSVGDWAVAGMDLTLLALGLAIAALSLAVVRNRPGESRRKPARALREEMPDATRARVLPEAEA